MIDQFGHILPTFLHYSFHFLLPGLLAFCFFTKEWRKAWLILIATMLVDLDHLLANPIFDASRCSIGFHILHQRPAIFIYALLLFFPRLRIIGFGLLLHMLTDYLDCQQFFIT